MQYLLLVCTADDADADGEGGVGDPGAWFDALAAEGRHLAGDRLRPAGDARTVRVRGGERVVRIGAEPGTTEAVVGFDLIEAADLDDAVAVAAAHPMARAGRIEVRPVHPL